MSKERIITNSLLFFLLRDGHPRYGYTIDDFNNSREDIIKELKVWLDGIENNEDEVLKEKEHDDQRILENHIEYPLTRRFQEILKKDYYQYFKESIPKKIRQEILERDGYKCQYCGVDLKECEASGFPAHVDHIKPRRSGGKHNPENLLACCWKCNLGKRDFDLFEYDDDPLE